MSGVPAASSEEELQRFLNEDLLVLRLPIPEHMPLTGSSISGKWMFYPLGKEEVLGEASLRP